MKNCIKKIDLVTYAVAQGRIEMWAWYHVEIEGGRLINIIDDVEPLSSSSSMRLWCIDYGSFGIALVEGIDRADESQVTRFVRKHGDHAVQHVAYETDDLSVFASRLEAHGVRFRGEIVGREEGLDRVLQLFCKGYDRGDPTEASFPEYLERRRADPLADPAITFSSQAGRSFYRQIEDASAAGDHEAMIDFSAVRRSWQPFHRRERK